MANEGRERDLVLAPQQFAYVQDQTKGHINTFVGPTKTSLSNTDQPVKYDPNTRRFIEVAALDQAKQAFSSANEGDYIVLENPADTGVKSEHPQEGTGGTPPSLSFGKKVNIPGPAAFPLWPSQIAKVIPGHTLRSNQYLIVRVYNEDAARENWGKAVLKKAEVTTGTGENKGEQKQQLQKAETNREAPVMITGKNIVIKGTDYSFFIPPTGLEVVPDEEGNYVRDAVTLERLEYCILINESGDKRYEKGPQVVFPDPTETFIRRQVDSKWTRRFRAYELSKLQGLYIQVIADYEEGDKKHVAGDEIFITGKEQSIYYPRPEHAIIKYGESEVHNAVAIPEGEARYILERLEGKIPLVKGPKMYLPDPRTEVIVRRILSADQVAAWFPGNEEAMGYNATLSEMQLEQGPQNLAVQNFVSEGAYRSITKSLGASAAADMGGLESSARGVSGHSGTPGAAGSASVYSRASNIQAAPAMSGDQVRRGTKFTPPRMVTIDTKYDGAVNISPHVGYAVQVVSKTGERQVIVGPAAYLLEYDETLQIVSLSTGKPKNTDRLEKTVYLQVRNNKVSDIIGVETADMCQVDVKVSYRVNFEGDPKRWFAVDNYVKFLCDHARSRLKREAKNHGIEQFYARATDIIRDCLLGKAKTDAPAGADKNIKATRDGLVFEENGMHVYDVEVLGIEIKDRQISTMLSNSSINAFRTTIELSEAAKKLDATKRMEDINRQIQNAQYETRVANIKLQVNEAVSNLELKLQQITSDLTAEQKKQEAEFEKQKTIDITATGELSRLRHRAEQDIDVEKARQVLRVEMIQAEAKALIEKFGAMDENFAQALLSLSNNETMAKIAQASAPLTLLGGDSIADVLVRIFDSAPGLKQAFAALKSGNGTPRIGAGSNA